MNRAHPLLWLAWLCLACPLAAAQSGATASDLDFERDGQGWTALAGPVTWSGERPAHGRLCLSLAGPAQGPVQALSAPLASLQPGQPLELSLSARRVEGDGSLTLWLAEGAVLQTSTPLWQGMPRDDSRWHRLALTVVCGLAAPRLVLGTEGAGTRWLVDDIGLKPARLAPVTRPVKPGLVPGSAAALPAGWKPEGDLDVRSRDILGIISYFLQVGPLELTPPREVRLRRGERTGFDLQALSRGDADKTLHAEVQGPQGWLCEPAEARLSGRAGVALNIPAQAMVAGEGTVRVQFTCEGDTRQMPLRAQVDRAWPAFGVSLESGHTLTPEQRAALAGLPVQLVRQPADAPLDLATERAADLVLGDRASEGATAVAPAEGTLCVAATAGSGVAPTAGALSIGPPLALSATAQGLATGMEAARASADAAAVLDLLSPALPGAVVLRESVDGRAPETAMTSWVAFDTAWNPWALLNELQARRPDLQVLADGISGPTTGDPSLDALLLARAVMHLTEGRTLGVTLPALAMQPGQMACLGVDGKPQAEVQRVFGELARELAGATPLLPPAETPAAGYLPGKPVAFRPFVRGDEGIIALWNNSQQRQSLAVEVRSMPVQSRLLRISWPGELIQREYVPSFAWDALAQKYRQPAVYVDVEPLQVVILSLKLRAASAQWLREVGPRPAAPPDIDPMAIKLPDPSGMP
jgi:hypothetical protein